MSSILWSEDDTNLVRTACTGDSVAIPTNNEQRKTPWAIVVPFSLPGEIVRVKVYRNARMYSVADLVEVVSPNLDLRDDTRVQCRYFKKCGGCQYQVCSYMRCLDIRAHAKPRCFHTQVNFHSSVTLL